MGMPQPRRAAAKAGVKMKPLFWERVLLPANGGDEPPTVWTDMADETFAVAEFETLFAAKAAPRRGGAGDASAGDDGSADADAAAATDAEAKKKKKKKEVARLLESQRSQAVAIMMTQLPPTVDELRDAVYSMDSSVLDEERIQYLQHNLPTSEELDTFR